jgi:hypothetical protein
LLGITSSIKNLVAPGKISPDSLLMMIRIRPINSCFLLGQMMVVNTCLVVTLRSFFDVMEGVVDNKKSLLRKTGFR